MLEGFSTRFTSRAASNDHRARCLHHLLSQVHQPLHLREMSPKRIASINVLLHVATTGADHLRGLEACSDTISHVEKLHLLGMGAKQEAEFFVAGTHSARGVMEDRR